MSATSNSSTTASSRRYGSTSNGFSTFTDTKYGGLIDVTFDKKCRNILVHYFSYVDSITIDFFMMHTVIGLFRLLQFLGPSIVAASISFWPSPKADGNNTLIRDIVGIISVFFHLVPPDYRDDCGPFLCIVYSCVFIIFFVLISISAYYLKKSGKSSQLVCKITSVFIGTIGYLFHPICCNIAFEMVVNMIISRVVNGFVIFSFLLSFLSFSVYMALYLRITGVSILFRPCSLMTVQSMPQLYILISTIFITFFSSVGSKMTQKYYASVLFFLGGIVSLVSIWIVFEGGSFVSPRIEVLFVACCLSGCINFFIAAVFVLLNRKGDEIILISYVVIFVLMFFASQYLVKKRHNVCLRKLDLIEEESSNFNMYIKSPKMFANTVTVGFIYAHPVCTTWALLQYGEQRWVNSATVWTVFAKFVAIYPEETRTLEWVQQNIRTNHLKGGIAKQTMEQISTVLRQREMNLSPFLKEKLNKISKIMESAKQRLRRIWDLVIQGNISEMDMTIKAANLAVQMCQTEFSHLLVQYPNNRFVCRSYTRFLKEIRGDLDMFNEWKDKIRNLQRGITISTDRTHELGIEAFPILPANISTGGGGKGQQSNILSTNDSEVVSTDNVEIDEESSIGLIDQTSSIRKTIDKLKPPGIRFAKACSLINLIVFLILPAVIMMVVSTVLTSILSQPLTYLYYFSFMRSLAFQISTFEIRYVMEELPLLNHTSGSGASIFSSHSNNNYGNNNYGNNNDDNIDNNYYWNSHANTFEEKKTLLPKYDFGAYKPTKSLGGFTTTREQLKFMLEKVTTAIQGLSDFRSYNKGDKDLDAARASTFSATIKYTTYASLDIWADLNLSLQDAMIDFSVQATKILDLRIVDRSVISTTPFLNSNNNCEKVASAINDALTNVLKYVSTLNNLIQKIVLILEIAVILGIAIYSILMIFVYTRRINSDKSQVYCCLTSLPKNVVSNVVESLRILKKDNADGSRSTEVDNELSKQEENILKVFSAASDNKKLHIGGQMVIIVLLLLILGLTIGTYIVLCTLYSSVGTMLVRTAPHLDYLLGSYGYLLGCFLSMYSIIISLCGYDEVDPDPFYILNRFNQRLAKFGKYYQRARYGVDEVLPFEGFAQGVAQWNLNVKCNSSIDVPTEPYDIITCSPISLIPPLLNVMLKKIMRPYELKQPIEYDTYDPLMNELWFMSSTLIYEEFFFPMFSEIVPELIQNLNSTIPSSIVPTVILIVLAILLEVLLWTHFMKTEEELKFSLGLLIQCPHQMILQSPKIMAVLGGDFTDHTQDNKTRDDEFFEKVVQNLPDAVICANSNYQIIESNKMFSQIFGEDYKDKFLKIDNNSNNNNNNSAISKYNTTLKKKFNTNNNGNNNDNNYENNINENNNNDLRTLMLNTMNIDITNDQITSFHTTYKKQDFLLNVTSTARNIFITIRDTTQNVTHEKLIKEEREKSDMLLSSILPPSLVRRVQNHETNISFAVQSATISFIDIVSFTPWCGSNTAATVMATLNMLFVKFDQKVQTHPTMTKIKCIGDCYMSAGGVFGEINQPSTHSKEVVEFGLEAIECIKEVNSICNEELQIRVGVNTGGPIVAGVLGIGKPTFEILGPAINMAQQMEHHGVPMQVHISRTVYELIYGGSFVVKERGEIEVKGGKINTYLVSDMSH